jgi:hypothetical protein
MNPLASLSTGPTTVIGLFEQFPDSSLITSSLPESGLGGSVIVTGPA